MMPFVICHMITSLDGRLLTDRWGDPYGAKIDDLIEQHYDSTADSYNAGAWMVGRKTMAHFASGERDTTLQAQSKTRPDHVAKTTPDSAAIVFDPSGKLQWQENSIDGDHIITVLSDRVEDSYLAYLRDLEISYIFAGPDGLDLKGALQSLAGKFGFEKLLLEGGGKLNGAFLAAGLINEMSTLICPTMDGLNGVPSIYDFDGPADARPAAGQHLTLLECSTLYGGVVWLRHAVHLSS